MSSGIVEVTINSAESGGEGEEAVETLRHSPRRKMIDRKKLADRLAELDQKSTATGVAKGNLRPVSSSSSGKGTGAAATTSMGNEVKTNQLGIPLRSQSDCDGSMGSGQSGSAGALAEDRFSSNMSLSACSLLDAEDNADGDDDDEGNEDDEDLGPMTRKAFTTFDCHTHGCSTACNGGNGGQPTRGGKLASILRRCGTCGPATYCAVPSCATCSGTASRTKRVVPTNGDIKPNDADASPKHSKRGVYFSETLVTDTHERPRTEDAELNDQFYNINDFRKFKRQARDEGHCEQQLIQMLRDLCTGLNDCGDG